MIEHFFEATKVIPTDGQYIPEYRRRYFMVWKAELPKPFEYNKVYEKREEDKILRRVYLPLIGYEDESKQEKLYWNAMRTARSILGL